ncbi:carbon monoxide dehydrogenase subunit G [Streptomyces turgidiscabies]|uniref:Carbon monoxide dehydrogenase subunit G n=1 Tax=Streptomyces turgidiscabies TaxID=85558 RepID=A0ABU0RNJ4_9ACTN|nr:carbon monoxide dehydrogenase subunit G [Streptomyces turgidiscabies]MDQ0933566.1 carbon monoxide dehydrogenase subunit G [Streptomyces turgidiscabies]
MDHEVFVPASVERLRDVLADPARIARAVPGLQQDAGTEPAAAGVAGRLKVRVAGHTITYRGSLRVAVADAAEDAYVVEGDAVEVRGGGAVKLALTLRVRGAESADCGAGAGAGESGCVLVFGGTVTADGRVSELPAEAVAAAGGRLLRRFGEGLGEVAVAGEHEGPSGVVEVDVSDAGLSAVADIPDDPGGLGDDDVDSGGQVPEGIVGAVEPPAEAAHARRTMIGRSAEEVDHAPPRGRYAPVPPPEQVVANVTLRWAAPAAALVVASAIVVGRVLRKRR